MFLTQYAAAARGAPIFRDPFGVSGEEDQDSTLLPPKWHLCFCEPVNISDGEGDTDNTVKCTATKLPAYKFSITLALCVLPIATVGVDWMRLVFIGKGYVCGVLKAAGVEQVEIVAFMSLYSMHCSKLFYFGLTTCNETNKWVELHADTSILLSLHIELPRHTLSRTQEKIY